LLIDTVWVKARQSEARCEQVERDCRVSAKDKAHVRHEEDKSLTAMAVLLAEATAITFDAERKSFTLFSKLWSDPQTRLKEATYQVMYPWLVALLLRRERYLLGQEQMKRLFQRYSPLKLGDRSVVTRGYIRLLTEITIALAPEMRPQMSDLLDSMFEIHAKLGANSGSGRFGVNRLKGDLASSIGWILQMVGKKVMDETTYSEKLGCWASLLPIYYDLQDAVYLHGFFLQNALVNNTPFDLLDCTVLEDCTAAMTKLRVYRKLVPYHLAPEIEPGLNKVLSDPRKHELYFRQAVDADGITFARLRV